MMFKSKLLPFYALLCLVCLLFAGGIPSVYAQRVSIDITKPTFTRIPIAIPDLKFETQTDTRLARQAADTLSKDLDFSGLFRPLDPAGFLADPQAIGLTQNEIEFPNWKRLGADYLVRGVYTVQGSSLRMEMRLFDVVGARMVVGKAYEGQVQDWKSMVHRFADEILFALTGERGPFGTRIAFVQVQGKNKEIYAIDFDGSNPVQITHDNNLSITPAWNREGSQLAYVSYKDGSPKIYVTGVGDGSHRLLAGYPGLNISPSWKPGGSELAVTLSKDGNPDLYLISSSGAVISRLAQSWGIEVSPSWSPDGRKLAFVSSESGNPQIYTLDVGSGQKHRLTFKGTYNTTPRWSPKGDLIAYTGLIGGRQELFTIRPDGGEGRQLTHGEGNNESPSWSPDGRLLAFSSTREGGSAIFVMSLNDLSVRRLTRLSGEQEMPDWSPRFQGR